MYLETAIILFAQKSQKYPNTIVTVVNQTQLCVLVTYTVFPHIFSAETILF